MRIDHRSIRSYLTIRSHRYPPVEIVFCGKRWSCDLAGVRRLLAIGLRPDSFELLGLIADAYHCSVEELMRLAVESEVQP